MKNLTLYVLRRLSFLVLVLLSATFIAFFLTRLLPGNPIARVINPFTSEEQRMEMYREANLHLPFYEQFIIYIGDVLRGDLGVSYNTSRPVINDLIQRFPASFELVFYAMLIMAAIAIPFGIISAVKQGGIWDQLVRIISVLGVSIPIFWFALILLDIFSLSLGWFPGPEGRLSIVASPPDRITGMYTIDAILAGNWSIFVESVKYLFLPTVVIAFAGIAPIARVTRSAMIDVLESDYIRAARSLGLPNSTILWRHAIKNALISILTIITAVFGFSLGGSVLVEIVFSWPGLGQYAYQATMGADFPAIQGFILLYTAFYVLVYLILDITIAIIDPRVEFSNE